MKQKSKIPTILGVVLLLAATFAGVFFINYKTIFNLGAEGESEPKDIRVSNITDSSLTVSWTTDGETSGFVKLGDQTSAPDEKSYTHFFTITGLKPNTSYTYEIDSGGTLYDNNGVPWQTSTAAAPISGSTHLASGSVLTQTAQPVKKALVYATIEGNLFSTVTSDSGNFVFQLPSTDPASTLVEIFVQAGPTGVSSAQIYLISAKPIPPIILGNTHDFRNIQPGDSGQIPSAELDLPENINGESKFSIPEGGTPVSTSTVTLENVDEGENVTSTQPEFFGKGPTNTTLTIEVHSEQTITDSVRVGSGGSWNWSPPQGLSPGLHTITVTWKDISGITRSLTRNFIVQAGEAPAFEATQSGQTPTPTSTATQTTTPTRTPTSTPTTSQAPSPTTIASATASASASPLPETGSLTSSTLFTILGLGVLALSFGIWKLAENA